MPSWADSDVVKDTRTDAQAHAWHRHTRGTETAANTRRRHLVSWDKEISPQPQALPAPPPRGWGSGSDQDFPQLVLLTVSRLLPQALPCWLGETESVSYTLVTMGQSDIWHKRIMVAAETSDSVGGGATPPACPASRPRQHSDGRLGLGRDPGQYRACGRPGQPELLGACHPAGQGGDRK